MKIDKWDDPCATYKELRSAYMALLTGTMEASVKYTHNGVDREVTYSKVDLQALKNAMGEAQRECEALTGGPQRARRFAITAGARRFR